MYWPCVIIIDHLRDRGNAFEPRDSVGEMKSAFERALERAEKLGKLSPEEIKESKEKEFILIGRALVEQYLGHGYGHILEEEMARYSGEEKDIVVKAALSRLVEAIDLGSGETAERAIGGMLVLKKEGEIGQIAGQIKSLFEEYKQAEKDRYEKEKGGVERKERELLRQLGISGSAVGEINLEASGTWRQILADLYSQFDQRLHQLKEQLLEMVS